MRDFTPLDLLRLTHFELTSGGDSVDVQDAVYNLSRRMEAIGVAPMTLEEADNAKFAIRDLRSRRVAEARQKGGAA